MHQAEPSKLRYFPQKASSDGRSPFAWNGFKIRQIFFDLLLLAPLLFFVCFYGTNNTSLHHVDETTHVRVTQEMLMDGQWWRPKVFGINYYNKPPFKMWLTALPVMILGESNQSYRVVDGICGVLTCLMLYFFALRLFRSRVAGISAVLLLLTSRSFIFIHGVRTSTQDAMLLTLLTGAMIIAYSFLERARELWAQSETAAANSNVNRKSLYRMAIAGGILVGLAVLTKNVAGFLPLIMIGVYLVVSGELFKVLRTAPGAIATILFVSLLVPALYLVPREIVDPNLMRVMFGQEVMNRVSEGYHNQDRPWFYLTKLFRYSVATPPALLLAGLVFGFYGALRIDRAKFLFLLVWTIFPVALFTFVPSRLTWYMAPAFPAMALLGGGAIAAAVFALSRALAKYSHREKHAHEFGISEVVIVLLVVFFLGQSAVGFGKNVDFVVNKILHPFSKRLPFDVMTENIRKYAKEHPAQTVVTWVYDDPQIGRNERVYLDMHPNVVSVQTPKALGYRMEKGPKPSVIYADIDQFQTLAEKFPFTSYAFFPPANHRNRWAVVLGMFDDTLVPFTAVKNIYDFDNATDIYLSGWSHSSELHGMTNRRNRGPYAALTLPGDRAKRMYGSTIRVNLGLIPNSKQGRVDIGVYFNDQKIIDLQKIHSGLKTYEFVLPASRWVTGNNVLSFHIERPEGKPLGFSEEAVMFNWLSDTLAQPIVSPILPAILPATPPSQ